VVRADGQDYVIRMDNSTTEKKVPWLVLHRFFERDSNSAAGGEQRQVHNISQDPQLAPDAQVVQGQSVQAQETQRIVHARDVQRMEVEDENEQEQHLSRHEVSSGKGKKRARTTRERPSKKVRTMKPLRVGRKPFGAPDSDSDDDGGSSSDDNIAGEGDAGGKRSMQLQRAQNPQPGRTISTTIFPAMPGGAANPGGTPVSPARRFRTGRGFARGLQCGESTR
jgi:hypothetical protein